MGITAQSRNGGNLDYLKPVLLLHVPKTAGTSFLLMLQNTFGDRHIRRIHTVDQFIQDTIDAIVEAELDELSCLAGHLPIYRFKDHLHKFQPFTVLREPVARVLSLYRFLRRSDDAELEPLGLRRGFSIGEMLDARHPQVYGQVNNGMVRMLAGEAAIDDPRQQAFWNLGRDLGPLESALANVQSMDFGLTEDMPATLALARGCWSIPYALREYRENTTSEDATGEDPAVIHRIIGMNTLDMALYHQARSTFRNRRPAPPGGSAARPVNPRAVFAPQPNRKYAPGDIPGRQGFHEFEANGMAWLFADQAAEIWFRPPTAEAVRLRLHIYCITSGYPVRDIAVRLNGSRLWHTETFDDDKWLRLETDRIRVPEGLNQLEIVMPRAIKVSELNPLSGDRRQLGIALAGVEFAI